MSDILRFMHQHHYPFSAVDRHTYYGNKVIVHYNALYQLFCVRDKDFRLISHAKNCIVVDVNFQVRQGQRTRAIATGIKNVHAFVTGTLQWMGWEEFEQGEYLESNGFRKVKYDLKPCHKQFYYAEGKYKPIFNSKAVVLSQGRVWAF